MRFLLSFCLIISLSFGFAQEQDKFIINLGLHQMNSANNNLLFRSDEGGYLLKQKSIVLYDVNFLYSKKLKGSPVCPVLKNLTLVIGAGFNQKGMNQESMQSGGTSAYYFRNYKLRRNYSSHYLGLSYLIKQSDKLFFEFGFLNNLDIDLESAITENTGFKALGWASRTYVTVGYRLWEKAALQLSPYFQYAFSNYLDAKPNNRHAVNYKPYGIGLSLGIAFLKD